MPEHPGPGGAYDPGEAGAGDEDDPGDEQEDGQDVGAEGREQVRGHPQLALTDHATAVLEAARPPEGVARGGSRSETERAGGERQGQRRHQAHQPGAQRPGRRAQLTGEDQATGGHQAGRHARSRARRRRSGFPARRRRRARRPPSAGRRRRRGRSRSRSGRARGCRRGGTRERATAATDGSRGASGGPETAAPRGSPSACAWRLAQSGIWAWVGSSNGRPCPNRWLRRAHAHSSHRKRPINAR